MLDNREDILRRSSVDSESGHPPSARLLAAFANDYSLYLKTDLSLQISKVEEFLEESVAKLEEFQSLFEMKESERKAWIAHVVPDLLRSGTLLSVALKQRLDTLTSLLLSVQSALDALETQVSQAETMVGIPSPTSSSATAIRSVFKYFIKTEESSSDLSLSSGIKPTTLKINQLNSDNPLGLDEFFH